MTPEPTSPQADTSPTDRPTVTMIVGDSQIDRRVLDQARSLNAAGCDVTVLAGPRVQLGPNSDEASYPDLRIVRIDPSKHVASYSTDDERLPKALQRQWGRIFDQHDYFLELAIRHEADVYTAHDLPQLPAAAIAAATTGAYLVFDAHELFPERQFFPPKTVSFLQEIERELAPLADLVITVNKSIAEIMAVRYGIDVPHVVLNCPSLHTPDKGVAHNDEIRKQLGLPEDVRILLYQGGLNDYRNLQLLVPAMSLVQHPDVSLVLMGNGRLRSALEDAALSAGLKDRRVFFLDAVPQHDLLRYTASADCGIIPYPHVDLNTYFCTPNKLFEFIVAGLPILANDSPELNRFVSQQGVGLNSPMRTAADIAHAIDAFVDGDLVAWRRAAQGLRTRYTWASESSTFIEAYETLVGTISAASVHQAYCNARAAFESGRHGDAIQTVQFLLQAAPRHVEAHILMSDVALAIDELDTAVAMLNAALAIDPRHPLALRKSEQLGAYRRHLEAMEPITPAA